MFVIVSHKDPPDALQGHPGVIETETRLVEVKSPPTVLSGGESADAAPQTALVCWTVTVWPATVAVPLRGDANASTPNVASPVPALKYDCNCTQSCPSARQMHVGSVVTRTEKPPPSGPTLTCAGETL